MQDLLWIARYTYKAMNNLELYFPRPAFGALKRKEVEGNETRVWLATRNAKDYVIKAPTALAARNHFIAYHYPLIQHEIENNPVLHQAGILYLELYPMDYLTRNEIYWVWKRDPDGLGAFLVT